MTSADVVHVIDDDDAVREAFTLLLTEEGFTVPRYRSAVEFLGGLDRAAWGCGEVDPPSDIDVRLGSLTPRELEVLLCLIAGNANKTTRSFD